MDIELKSYINTLICALPLIWGVYEFKQFRGQVDELKKKADVLNKKLDNVLNNDLEDYKFLKDLKELMDKINGIIK
tara:strand:- start:44 stop:271 length:228 start_codon:yes stop_codon:yes gene_type:complete